MTKNLGNINKSAQNYKLFLDKLRNGLLNQLRNSNYKIDNSNNRVVSWFGNVESIKATIQLMTKFLGKESSPIFAQKVFRTYHIVQLHSKLWSNKLLIKFGKNILNNYSRLYSKRWLYGLVLLSFCDSSSPKNSGPSFLLQHSIEEKELAEHMSDLDYIHELTAATVVCPKCNDRLVVDKKVSTIEYCHCPDAMSAYNRKIDGYSWTPFVETPDLLVWRQPIEDKPGLFMYKVYGYYNDISPNDFLATQLDVDYRRKWDSLSAKLNMIEEDKENNVAIIHWEMQWPKFFANRDYVFARRHTVNKQNGTMVILNKAITYSEMPEVNGVVRVKEYYSVMHIKAVKGMDEPGVEFGLTYYDNPGLSLPQWLTNYLATVSIPDFLNQIRVAARGRRMYEKNQIFNFYDHAQTTTIDTDSTSNPNTLHESSSKKAEILSTFFKDNFLEQPSTLGEA